MYLQVIKTKKSLFLNIAKSFIVQEGRRRNVLDDSGEAWQP